MTLKCLKIEEDLHTKLKTLCSAHKVTVQEAVHQAVTAWVEDVETQIPDLQLTRQTKAKGAIHQFDGSTSRPLERDATYQQANPKGGRR